jgi:hypothetical protein
VASPMSLREAVEIVAHGCNDYCASCERTNEYHRAQAIVDAAVEDIERIPALKLAAYRAGVEAAAKACEADAGRYCEAHPWSASDQRAVQAFDAGYTSGAYGGAKAARAVPDPAPEQLERIK